MITFSKLGNYGRLGNALFEYASCYGIAKSCNTELIIPEWSYTHYFENEFKVGKIDSKLIDIKEPGFHYSESFVNYIKECSRNNDVDILGYLQTEKYWEHCVEEVKKQLTFTNAIIEQSKSRFEGEEVFSKQTIAVSIRRGDYVNNLNYENLPFHYYILALEEHFPKWREENNILVFSDDIPYCKVHFAAASNVFFSENNSDIEDICLMSQCNHFIIANSTFSWWGAYLGEKYKSIVVRPNYLFAGKLLQGNDWKDFYPKRWSTFDYRNEDTTRKVIDLTDTTFIIPVNYDSIDRKKNLDLSLCLIQHYFKTNIIVMEQGGDKFEYVKDYCTYLKFEGDIFHRTKMLNDMTKLAKTPYIANWDADIFIAPLQIYEAVNSLRNEGAKLCYPYDGRFARMPRMKWFGLLELHLDIGIVGDTQFNGMEATAAESVGGAVFFNKEYYMRWGGENENFISFGAEDVERYDRMRKLDTNIKRISGALYHMNHWIGVNSSKQNPYFVKNADESLKIKTMTHEQLINYIKTWKWTHWVK